MELINYQYGYIAWCISVGKDEKMQLSFFQLDDPVLVQIKEEIEKTDIDNLTPVKALNKLLEIKKILG